MTTFCQSFVSYSHSSCIARVNIALLNESQSKKAHTYSMAPAGLAAGSREMLCQADLSLTLCS